MYRVAVLFWVSCLVSGSAFAQQAVDSVVPNFFLDPSDRGPVEVSFEVLPEGVAGMLPITDGSAFSLSLLEADMPGGSPEEILVALGRVLPAAGWVGDLDALDVTRQGDPLGSPNPQSLEEENSESARVFLEGLAGELGKVTQETEAAARDAAQESLALLAPSEQVWRFEQLVEGIPAQGMGVVVVTDGRALRTVHGALYNDPRLANSVVLDAQEASRFALEHVNASAQAELASEPEKVVVADGPDLLAAWQMTIQAAGAPYLVSVDAESGDILQVQSEFASVSAKGRIFNPDPGVGTATASFEVDSAGDKKFSLGLTGVLTLANGGADGNTGTVTVADGGLGSADFDVASINDTTNVTNPTGAGYNTQFQHVHLYAWVYKLLDDFHLRGTEPLPAWSLTVNGPDACGNGRDNACGSDGYLYMGSGGGTLGLRNSALDASVVIHETTHGINRIQMNVGKGAMNASWDEGVADYFAMSQLRTDMIGAWFVGSTTPVQNGYLPRQAEALDVFPNHLVNNNEGHANGQVIAWALWSTRNELVARNPLGAYAADLYLIKALRNAGVGQSASGTEKAVYDSFQNILTGMMAQAGSSLDAADILAGFARAGIFVSNKEAIISVDDDYIADTTAKMPTFTVWTGRNFAFVNTSVNNSAVYNTHYTIELANDPSFTTNLVSSGDRNDVTVINGLAQATWQLSQKQWDTLKGGDTLYYRVTTTDNAGGNKRDSQHWNAQANILPPGKAIINKTGTVEEECGCDTSGSGGGLLALNAALGLLVSSRRRRVSSPRR